MTPAPFSFGSELVRSSFLAHRGIDLLKLGDNSSLRVMFGQSEFSRLLVPIHWDRVTGRSRKCEGSTYCDDCAHGVRKAFHLYAGVYLMDAQSKKVVVDLATSLPQKWLKNPPDFRRIHRISRKSSHGPVCVEALPHCTVQTDQFPGWDIIDDVIQIFKGRHSLSNQGDGETGE